ncbi:MAG: hypothetical protein JW834_02840 [Candidatus Diapherotrites archaeon]|nr:hypothetical protein [Candidatus Diapherotrites archaeon]
MVEIKKRSETMRYKPKGRAEDWRVDPKSEAKKLAREGRALDISTREMSKKVSAKRRMKKKLK